MGGIVSLLISDKRPINKKALQSQSSTSSTDSNSTTQSDISSEDQINVKILFSALHKISGVFEIKESLRTSLIDPNHTSFNQQFVAVEKWIKKYCDVNVTAEEINYLIKYVELYQPLPNSASPLGKEQALSPKENASDNECRLMCPYRHEMASFTGQIRNKEAERIIMGHFSGREATGTLRMNSLDDGGGGMETETQRFLQQINDNKGLMHDSNGELLE